MVSTRLYPNRISVVAGDTIVASHDRLADRGQTCYDWQHYIPLVARKPGALRNGAPFMDLPAPLNRLRQGLLRHEGGDRVMAQVLAAVPTAGLDAVGAGLRGGLGPGPLVAVEWVMESGALSAEHVLNVLARLNTNPAPLGVALGHPVETSLQLYEAPAAGLGPRGGLGPLANTDRYDRLRATDEDDDDVVNATLEVDHE